MKASLSGRERRRWRPTFLGSHHPWAVSTEMEAASLNHKVLPERFGVCVCVYIDQ